MPPVRAAFLLVFFTSGVAALLYQTIWQRILTLFSGSDIHSVTIVVAAFMAGLGFGNLAGGYAADRLPAGRRVLAFALCEIAVAIFAASSTTIYYDWLYVRLGAYTISRTALGLIVFLVTLWPTFFMGMSLPLAAKALTDDARQPARWVSILYGWNTLGAAAGSFLAVGVLFRTMDFTSALRLGAGLNLACAAASLVVRGQLQRSPAGAAQAVEQADPEGPADRVLRLETWMAIYALSGFMALSLEIVWFRILGVMLKSNSMTFGLLLATYLGGVGLGALFASTALVRRWRPAQAFFTLQLAIPVYASLALTGLLLAVAHLPWAQPLWAYMAGAEPLAQSDIRDNLGVFLLVYAGIPALIIGPPTVFMGMAFGLLQRAVQTDLEHLGRRVGWLQTANIAGSMLGATLTGLFLLDLIGSIGVLRLLVGIGLLLRLGSLPMAGVARRRNVTTVLALATALLTIAVMPSANHFWARLHGTTADAIHGEDGTGVTLIKQMAGGGRTMLYASGLGQSTVPYGGVHTELAALPLMLHPNPQRIAIIGLGSGDTVFASGGRTETQVIDSIEIIAPELTALYELNRRTPYAPLASLLGDRRVRYTFTDGRAFLRHSTERYDIIEADALRPRSAYSGNLYSVEYFELLRSRLRPGGFAVTWAPTPRVRDTVIAVFPHVRVFGGIVIGSDTPIAVDHAVVTERMHSPAVRQYYGTGGMDIERLVTPLLDAELPSFSPAFDRTVLLDLNRDLFPRDEFALPYTATVLPAR